MIYWDTSVLLKLYVEEGNSFHWQELAIREKAQLRTSALAYAEMAHALKQKEKRREIALGSAQIIFEIFKEDIDAGRLLLLPLGTDVLTLCVRIAMEMDAVRTLDGLHLSTAKLARCARIATADKRLGEAAVRLGMEVITLDERQSP